MQKNTNDIDTLDTSPITTNHLKQDRLLSLIEFAQQSARLKLNPTKDVMRHGIFHRFEHELITLPGVHINVNNDEDESWLCIERLTERMPPIPQDNMLVVWLELSKKPDTIPTLKTAVQLTIAAHEKSSPSHETPKLIMNLIDYEHQEIIHTLFDDYLKTQWLPWAHEEKKRRLTIKLYSELFTLKQELEGSITDSQIEVVWGMGLGIWKTPELTIRYPLLTQAVELSLNRDDMSIEIKPRQSAEPLLALDVYRAIDNPGVAEVEKAYDDLITHQTTHFSPFDRASYEPQLQLAVTHLDAKGVYWPHQTIATDRDLPKADATLKVTDTWLVFARPRSKSLYIQDLEHYKKQLNTDTLFDPRHVINDLITEPSEQHQDSKLTMFRGLSNLAYNTHIEQAATVKELFFPLPFNEEQVSIIQKLDHANCVVVQGPPGTGKTHTIANIIAHYMANGKRILVTSMKEPALSVLKEKLPATIQPLAISLLTHEQDGMKQFEFAITKIAQELQAINRHELKHDISRDDVTIDQLHAKLAWIDRSLTSWANKNIEPIEIDGQTIHPEHAAKELAQARDTIDWLDETITIDEQDKPCFDDNDIIRLRQARLTLKNDLDYLGKTLPSLASMPTTATIIQLHQNLIKRQALNAQLQLVDPVNIEQLPVNLKLIRSVLTVYQDYNQVKQEFSLHKAPWLTSLQSLLMSPDNQPIVDIIDNLAKEVSRLQLEKNAFLESPVTLPADLLLTDEVIQAIADKNHNKQPFGLGGLFTKRQLLKKIAMISILGKPAQTLDDWQHVYRYILMYTNSQALFLKWNNIVTEIAIFSTVELNSLLNPIKHIKETLDSYFLCKKYLELTDVLQEHTSLLLRSWPGLTSLLASRNELDKLMNFLSAVNDYHASTAIVEQQALLTRLSACNGRVSEFIKTTITNTLGDASVNITNLQDQWTALINELNRINLLEPALNDVQAVVDLIIDSGGINWAKRLCECPLDGSVDYLLPDNWHQAWRLRRLSNYFHSVNHFDDFKTLTLERYDIEKLLKKTYQDVIAKRTWLALATNATPSIRAALQMFQSAISKIGKGTGKRANRYRRDARNAALIANKAIPCWIMPHYRISESLPAEFGCFDLVIIDEASQSDLSALPAILRANKLLIVGDDKQVSPEGVGLEEEKITHLMNQFLSNQVDMYRHAMSPERSIYDLCKIVFADSQIMLREHFRSVAPIIEYSKREFYNHALRPLRLPTKSERLDPPLIDVIVEDGFRRGKENIAEAQFIIEEIKKICDDPQMNARTIGVVSLLGYEQARKIWEMIQKNLSPEQITQHAITCGDAMTFQGKERDIMFLSMVATKDHVKANSHQSWSQRFNVAASRARDRMYLVRSIELDDLSSADHLRRGLIEHFSTPFIRDEKVITISRELCESGFERDMYDLLIERGYRVIPQVNVGNYRIDLVVEGANDARLAIECDGDNYHDTSKWDSDMNRQRILERAGWQFWRCFASTFVINHQYVVEDLINTLTHHGIEPIGGASVIDTSIHCEFRRIKSIVKVEKNEEMNAIDFNLT